MQAVDCELRELEQFIFAEVRCIDERRWIDWLDLFDVDGDYWVPLCLEDKEPGSNLSIIYEDRAKLELRCRRYAHPAIHAQIPPSTSSHVVSNVMLDRLNSGACEYELHARFTMHEYRLDKRVDWAGAFQYILRKKQNGYKIKRKKVLLIDTDSQMETIQVPF